MLQSVTCLLFHSFPCTRVRAQNSLPLKILLIEYKKTLRPVFELPPEPMYLQRDSYLRLATLEKMSIRVTQI